MLNKFKTYLPIIFFIVSLILIQNWWRIDLYINPLVNDTISPRDVTLYSTSWCRYCEKTRRFLDQANIPYTEYDIEKSTTAYRKYEQLGGRGVPVIRIGDTTIQGYDTKAIRKAINTESCL